MGKPKASRKRVVKKKEEEVVDDVAVSDNDSIEEQPAKNGNVENSEDDLQEEEHEVEKGKGRRGRGKPAPKAKKAAQKSPAEGKRRGRTSAPAPSKKSKKEEESDVKSDEDEEDKDKEYEVEKILEVRFRKGGKREFSIQWKGYGPKGATWEPEENLECQELLDSFMEKLGNVRPKVSKKAK